jgi:hypothetical protein
MALPERGLEHMELVRVHRALHDVLAQTPCAGDEHRIAETAVGVEREDHAAGAAIGAHHLHHAHRLQHLEMIEAPVDAVADGALVEQAREAAPHRIKQPGLARHIEKAVVLAGEAGGRQVFRGGGTAHCDARVLAVLVQQPGMRSADLVHQGGWQRNAVNDLTGASGPPREVGNVALVQSVQRQVQARPRVTLVERVPVGGGGDGKAIGDANALGGQLAHHLAERSILAAHQGHVGRANVAEPADEARRIHERPAHGLCQGPMPPASPSSCPASPRLSRISRAILMALVSRRQVTTCRMQISPIRMVFLRDCVRVVESAHEVERGHHAGDAPLEGYRRRMGDAARGSVHSIWMVLLLPPSRLGRVSFSTPSSSFATTPLASISCATEKPREALP